MDWSEIAPMVVGVAFMLITALTILLWPVSRRLGHLLQIVIQEKGQPGALPKPDVEDVLRRVEARLARLVEEQRFTSALLAAAGTAAEPGAPADRFAATPPA